VRSERDGWAHLYFYDAEGKLIRQLTEGELPVERVVAVDKEQGHVYYAAPTSGKPYERHLWRVSLEGDERRQLTEAPGRHQFELSPSFRFFVDTHSSVERPPVSELRSTEGGEAHILTRADVSALENLGLFPGEPFVAKAADGETDLHGIIYVPWDFDPAKRYAVIDYIYGGPFLSVVHHDYGQDFLGNAARGIAQLGYVVFVVDARGTPGRSKAFQDANYGIIGQVVPHDHAAVLREIAATRPYMDLERTGIIGASWGGYFTAKTMLVEPDVFHVGVAIVAGDLSEEATINEPNMGLPEQNPEGYRIGSITHGVRNLKGKLLLAHGTSDVNAPSRPRCAWPVP
jgi:dipeptidyl aminopeptidase/acylaminoacyl peptidase